MVSAVVFHAVLVVVTEHSSNLFFLEDAISGNDFSLIEDISLSDVVEVNSDGVSVSNLNKNINIYLNYIFK